MSFPSPLQETSSPAPFLRRNKKKPACEVCRKHKLACDHAIPTCSRCFRRGLSSQCIYHPFPMKKHASSKFTKTRISKITKDSPSTDPYQHVQTPVEVPIFGLELNSRVLPKNAPIRAADDRVGPRGPTSFSAIFADNQADLGSGLWDVETEIVRDHDFCSSEKIRSTTTAQKDLHLGMKVLSVIPDRTRCFALMDRYFTAFHPMDPILHQPTVKLWYDGLWGFFDRYFGESREPKKLRGMVQRICKNQQGRTDPKVLKDYERWVAAFTGPCLRWETVGILFAISGIACMTHPAWDKARNSTHDHLGRSTFAQQMLSCVRDCLRLCDSFEDVNDLSVYLLYLHLTLRFMCGEEGKAISLHAVRMTLSQASKLQQ